MRLEDLVPGSRWVEKDSQLVCVIVVGPHCEIVPCYGYTSDRQAPITQPDYKDQPVVKFIYRSKYPLVVARYVAGTTKYLNKCTRCKAYNFMYYYQPLKELCHV